MAQQSSSPVLMYGLIAVGGYFIYTYLRDSGQLVEFGIAPANVALPPGTEVNTPAETTEREETSPPPAAPTEESNLRARILDLASATPSTTQNFWQWGYFYEQASGEPSADPFTIPDFQGKTIPEVEAMQLTYGEWAAYMTQAGYSGLSGLGYLVPVTSTGRMPALGSLGTYGGTPQPYARHWSPVAFPWSQSASAEGGMFDRG